MHVEGWQMIRLMSNMDMARYVLPEPAMVNLVKRREVDLPRMASDDLPSAASESIVNLPRRSPLTSNTERKLKDLRADPGSYDSR